MRSAIARICALILLISISARGEVPASSSTHPAFEYGSTSRLPLAGYFRAGRCMPLEPSGGSFHLMLSESSADALHALAPDEKLVAVAPGQSALAQALFPNESIVEVPLTALAGDPIAWNSLDAWISADAPPTSQIARCLGAGIAVAIAAPRRPDDGWPWQPIAGGWVLRPVPSAAAPAILGEQSYLPAAGWRPEVAPLFRQRAVFAALLVSVLCLSTLLVRSNRRRWIALALVATGSTISLETARRLQPGAWQFSRDISLQVNGLQQIERWTWYESRRDGAVVTAGGMPVLVSEAQAHDIALVGSAIDENVRWTCRLPRGRRVAFVERVVSPLTLSR